MTNEKNSGAKQEMSTVREMVCIVCPVGCRLKVTVKGKGEQRDDVSVSGNRCRRGEEYAREEILAPKRVVTATCRIAPKPVHSKVAEVSSEAEVSTEAEVSLEAEVSTASYQGLDIQHRRLPVRTDAPLPLELIDALLKDIYTITAVPPVQAGDVLIENFKNTGVNLLASRSVE